MSIEVRPVSSRQEKNLFLTFPWRIYQNDPLWVPPLIPQHKERIDPAQNPVVAGGDIELFIAWRNGEPVGTIATAIDAERNTVWEENRAMFGFFECIEEYDVAEALYRAALNWANQHQKSSIWGPWPLDYEDSHGFLIKGFDHKPALMCAHTTPYYAAFAERFGFTKARRDSLAFMVEIPTDGTDPIVPKLRRVAQRVRERNNVVVRPANFADWDAEMEKAVDVLNRGLAVLDERGFWNLDRMTAHAKTLRPVLDPDLVLMAEIDGYPVGWVLGMPDLNEAIEAAGGLQHWWRWPQFWLNLRKQPAGASVKSIAVDPEYWNRGVDALLMFTFAETVINKGYTWLDMSLTGEDNPMTPRLAATLGTREYKRYRVFEIST